MQLLALNALLLFDAIFILFLFLVSVSCLLYYLPLVPPSATSDENEGDDLNTVVVTQTHPITHILPPKGNKPKRSKEQDQEHPIEIV